MSTDAILIQPDSDNVVWLKYTLLEPVSHHDPGQADKSNFSMYRRQLLRTTIEKTGRPISEMEADRILDTFRVPTEIVTYFEDEPFSRFVAVCIIQLFIDAYSSEKGVGLFEGLTRYKRLEDRCTQTAIRVSNLKEFWSVLTKEMQVPSFSGKKSDLLLMLLSVPRTFASSVLYEFNKYSQLIRMLASAWTETVKLGNEQYATEAKKPQTSGIFERLNFEMPDDTPSTEISIALPVHSGNDIRHDVRAGCMYHLLETLRIGFDDEMPLHVRTLLENGGAMGDKKQPANAFARAQQIRTAYPHLGLLGGCMPDYMLGESNLQSVSAYWKGRENSDALEEIGVECEASVEELLDRWTLTRHSLRTEESPMPMKFETIQAGAQLYVRFQFHPFITGLEIGAFDAGIEAWQTKIGSIGGQSAKGFGRVSVEKLIYPDRIYESRNDYERYLAANRDRLFESLLDGSMGVE